ncbi:uncharacterized protein LOC105200328 [Solenopsis invicta]|uniref:uncharacterized protein LOC105200328 n=1 Tax=Solenopsis invicta TaxID=13686 RepID=UPI000E33DAF5|nr:uncharacterized protein LOC105200328 [Solenopsis invicta]
MADEQEEVSIKARLSKLHCPFTWEILDSTVKYSTIHSKSDENMDPDETYYPLERLLVVLFKCYQAVSSADSIGTQKIEQAGELLIQIQQEKDFQQIIRAIEHVFYGTKCFVLYETDNMDYLEEILNNIIKVEDFTNVETGALSGCESVIWSCLNDFGIDKAIDAAKKAVEKNEDCALWHYILAKNLRRQRRLINVSSNVSNSEKKHFEIAYAMSNNHIFGMYYLQMRIECFHRFSRASDYVMKKNVNEKEVMCLAKKILKTKPTNKKVLLRLALMFLRATSDERVSAKECLDALKEMVPNNPTYLHYTAMLYEQCGDYKEALQYFKKAAECNNFVAELSYIQYGWEVGELEPIPHLLRMLKKYEQSIKDRQITVLLAIAVAYYSLHKDIPNSSEFFLKALSVDPLSKKFEVYYKCFDFKSLSISSFLNNEFCPLLEKKYSRTLKKTCEEIKKLLHVKDVNNLLGELCNLSVDITEKDSNLNIN